MGILLEGKSARIVFSCAMMLGTLGVLSGCAFTPAELALKPPTSMSNSDVGHGTPVSFKFVDERDDVTVGHRGVSTMGAKISAQDLPGMMEADLRKDIANKQFAIAQDGQHADAEVIFRLRSFKFDIESGFFTGGRNANAALAVDARRGDKTYNNVYRYNSEQRILFVPGESEINQQMNAALDQILTKAYDDGELSRFLSGH
jgi:uncharacterized lipoprotein